MEPAGCKYSDIIIEPGHIDFEIDEGSRFNPPTQDIFLKKVGSGLPASWDAYLATQGSQWLVLRPMSGSVPKRVRVYCKSIGMPAGEYSGEIRISSHVKVTPSVIPIKLKIKGKEPPEEPGEPPEQPPEEPPTEPPGEPPTEPPESPPSEPPGDKWSWLRKFIEWLFGLFGKNQ